MIFSEKTIKKKKRLLLKRKKKENQKRNLRSYQNVYLYMKLSENQESIILKFPNLAHILQ
jgi:hypothetical protein